MATTIFRPPRFVDRTDAGGALARALSRWRGADACVVGIPPGGILVAEAVASALGLPLHCAAIRTVESLAGRVVGAVDTSGTLTCDAEEERRAGMTAGALDDAVIAARRALDHVVHRLQPDAFRPALAGKTAILVDDVLLTPSTALAAIGWARELGARYVVYAAPAGRARAIAALRSRVDQLVVLGKSAELDDGSEVYALAPRVSDADVEASLAHFSTWRPELDQAE